MLVPPWRVANTRRVNPDEPGVGGSLRRALRIVEAVADAGDGVTAKALARRLGTPLPTVYRVLGTLVEEGYLVRLHAVRGYGLGYRVVDLYRGLTDQIVPSPAVRELLAELHTGIGAATYLVLLRDTDVVVAHADSCTAHPGVPGLRVGEPVPGHATALGKAVLAHLDPGRLADVLTRCGTAALTAHTMTERRLLDRELLRVRSAGVAVEVEEYRRGTAGIALPLDAGGRFAALGVSVSRAEFGTRRWELERAVRDAAGPLTRQLAGPGAAASG